MDNLRITGSARIFGDSATIRLSSHPTSLRAARAFVDRTLEGWGWTDHVATAVLLTSELVTNAVIHVESDVVVTMRGDGPLRVEVFDESIEQPSRDRLCCGRGLRVVEALATSWGVRREGRGKAVWFELAC
jgi:hypothetical protein